MHSNKLWPLKRVHLFHALKPERLRRLLRTASARSYARRQLILAAEDVADGIHIVRDGRVKLSSFDERGREITLGILEEGELFGEETAAADVERRDHAEALTDVEMLRISCDEFEELLEENRELSSAVVKQMAQRLLGTHERIEALGPLDAERRLAGTLLCLAESHGTRDANGAIRIELQLARQELAALLGSTRKTTIELLDRFERDRLIERDRNRIVLREAPRLQQLLEDV